MDVLDVLFVYVLSYYERSSSNEYMGVYLALHSRSYQLSISITSITQLSNIFVSSELTWWASKVRSLSNKAHSDYKVIESIFLARRV